MTMRTIFIKNPRLKNQGMLLLGALTLATLLMNLEFSLFEANLYDWRMSRGLQTTPSAQIVLITLDDPTSKKLDEFLPLPPQHHIQLLKNLQGKKVRAVGYLIDLNQVVQSHTEVPVTTWGNQFRAAAHQLSQEGTPFLLGTPYDVTGEVVPPFPLSTLNHSVAVIHKDGNVFAEDKVTRRALFKLDHHPAFHLELAHSIQPTPALAGTFEVPELDAEYFFFKYHGDPAQKPYPTYSFVDVLEGRVGAKELSGKIVLVGTLSKEDSSDFAFSPYSRQLFATPKINLHANILDSILNQESIRRAPFAINWLLTFSVTLLVLWSVARFNPRTGLIATFGLAAWVVIMGHALFQLEGIWIRESQPLVGIFLGYYLSVPYRLIREYQKRWDYQRKNELLTQVEELKSNFVYLVTHDLKTPVARIQGLAEMLLRRSKSQLNEEDQSTIQHMIRSTEELNHFINSILELTRLESNQLKLELESKDVNHLVERAVRAFEAQARAKSIDIKTELDPLFSIQIDQRLITKVLNNLIDNAIKYSPSESTVWIRSKEVDQFVEISVQDEGIGLSTEEQQSLFTRFYRAKNDTTTQITGTGLGLYLTKYFVEAHQGRVEVQSTPGHGSHFKIFLPVQFSPQLQETAHA